MHPFRTSPKIFSVSVAFALLLLAASSAHSIVVTTTVDENGTNPEACGLREAVRAINDQASFGGCVFVAGDTLVELAAETYTLDLDPGIGFSPRVEISRPLTISGQGPGQTIIERADPFDADLLFIFVEEPGTVLLEGFTIQGARGFANRAVTFIAGSGLELVLRDMVLRDNVVENSAPFYLQGDSNSQVLFERVIFEHNTNFMADGGGAGIDCSSKEPTPPSIRLIDVIFRGNTVSSPSVARGGGISSSGCDLELENVTFDTNSVIATNLTSSGGGLYVASGFDSAKTATLTNVTFYNNSADLGGGLYQALEEFGTLSLTLSNVTFAGNMASEAGDHLYQFDGGASLRNVLFGPSPGDGCDSESALSVTLLGGNMDADSTCGAERTEADPGLAGALASLGGFTPVLPLLEGAAAVDSGINTGCPAVDQRGAPRPFDGDGVGDAICDVGAFEFSDIDVFFDGFESGDAGAWSSTVGAQ